MRNVQSVAGRPPLRLNANFPDAGREAGQLIGDLHQLSIELFVLHALEHLVVAVEAAVEPVMGTAPQALAKFGVVFPPLPGGREKSQRGLQILAGAVVGVFLPARVQRVNAGLGCLGTLRLAVFTDDHAGRNDSAWWQLL